MGKGVAVQKIIWLQNLHLALMIFNSLLYALSMALRLYARRSDRLRALMAQQGFVAQIRVKDGSCGRWYRFSGGKLTSSAGIAADPDVLIQFKFDALPVRSGNYAIHIAPYSEQSKVIEVALADESIVLDEIMLGGG